MAFKQTNTKYIYYADETKKAEEKRKSKTNVFVRLNAP